MNIIKSLLSLSDVLLEPRLKGADKSLKIIHWHVLTMKTHSKPDSVKIIECPRDAMQGIRTLIPKKLKISYLQALIGCGFDTLDFGSFVSPKAIPQMVDTAKVLECLDLDGTTTKLLAIIANMRGAQEACTHEKIHYLGYPFSISENFQMRNTHRTIADSVTLLKNLIELIDRSNKKLVVYLSMGFGNPYGDPWNSDITAHWIETLSNLGVKIISLSDTIGSATPEVISALFEQLIPAYPCIELGAHLHTTPDQWHEKTDAAFQAGCRRFDGAIQGFGGCPMAKDELTGNMPTEKILSYFTASKIPTEVNMMRFEAAYNKATALFSTYH